MIEIRQFSEKDAEEVFSILKENFENPWSLNIIKEKNPFSIKIVAKIGEQIAGFLSGEIIIDEGNILMIAVKKDFQRKKIGEKLLKEFLKVAREKDVKKVFLEVSEKNIPALNFYRKHGFKIAYVRKKYYKNGENAIVMEKEIFS